MIKKNTREEINKTENNKSMDKSNKTKSDSLKRSVKSTNL